jgi:phosphoglycerate dehydrogenase-like enzyme
MGYINEDKGLDGRNPDTASLTAEFTIGLAIASYRGLPMYIENQKNKKWIFSQQQSLDGKMIAVIGNGNIGKRMQAIRVFAPRAQVTNFSRTGSRGSLIVDKFFDNVESFDVIIVLADLNDTTINMFNKDIFSRMKDGALFINMSKGPIVNTMDLVEELHKDRIFAAIDQVDPDPLPADHPLWDCPNLILTPHVASNAR